MPPSDVGALRRTADRQDGVVTRAQLAGLGFSPDAVRHRVRDGSLTPVWRGVYALWPLSDRGRARAATLATGPHSAASFDTSTALSQTHPLDARRSPRLAHPRPATQPSWPDHPPRTRTRGRHVRARHPGDHAAPHARGHGLARPAGPRSARARALRPEQLPRPNARRRTISRTRLPRRSRAGAGLPQPHRAVPRRPLPARLRVAGAPRRSSRPTAGPRTGHARASRRTAPGMPR